MCLGYFVRTYVSSRASNTCPQMLIICRVFCFDKNACFRSFNYHYYYYYYCVIVSFMQGSHTHIPETNHVPRGYIDTAILSLLFMVLLCLVPALVLLFFYVSTFRSMCAVPNMAVFCSSLTSLFSAMSLTYFLNVLEIAPVAPISTGITLVFTFHMRSIIIIIIIILGFVWSRIVSCLPQISLLQFPYCLRMCSTQIV